MQTLDGEDKRAMVQIVAVVAGTIARDTGLLPNSYTLTDEARDKWTDDLMPHFTVQESETEFRVTWDSFGLIFVKPLRAQLPIALNDSSTKQSITDLLKTFPRLAGKEIKVG